MEPILGLQLAIILPKDFVFVCLCFCLSLRCELFYNEKQCLLHLLYRFIFKTANEQKIYNLIQVKLKEGQMANTKQTVPQDVEEICCVWYLLKTDHC